VNIFNAEALPLTLYNDPRLALQCTCIDTVRRAVAYSLDAGELLADVRNGNVVMLLKFANGILDVYHRVHGGG